MSRRYWTVYMLEGSRVYHRRRDCPYLARAEQAPEARSVPVPQRGPRSGRCRYRPCHVCAVEP